MDLFTQAFREAWRLLSTGDGDVYGITARTAAIAILAILITLFAVFNLNEVKVSYVVGSGKAPLIIVIVISVVFGIVLTYFAERRTGKKAR